ncbi:MAG: hypothetical protein AB4352_29045 [Hormoscilla sp.]
MALFLLKLRFNNSSSSSWAWVVTRVPAYFTRCLHKSLYQVELHLLQSGKIDAIAFSSTADRNQQMHDHTLPILPPMPETWDLMSRLSPKIIVPLPRRSGVFFASQK